MDNSVKPCPKKIRKYSQADAGLLTLEELRHRLHYDTVVGVFIWKNTHRHRLGMIAGSTNRNGYKVVNIRGVLYRQNRLAFFYMTGRWPASDIDHKNGIRTDDSWSNLREATRSQNNVNRNLTSIPISGAIGVRYEPNRRLPYRAFMSVGNKPRCLGNFATVEEASEAYQSALKARFGNFVRTA